jgi:Ca2+-binding RTX toxin-like protein
MADLSASISLPGVVDAKYNDADGLVYAVARDGNLYRWNPQTGEFLAPIAVGTQNNAIDFSADGRYVLIADRADYSGPDNLILVHRVDLVSGDQTTFEVELDWPIDVGDPVATDIAVTASGSAVFDAFFATAGGPMRTFDWTVVDPLASTVRVAESTPSPHPLGSGLNGAMLIASEDDRYVVALNHGGSSGSIQVYDSASQSVIGSTDLFDVAQGAGAGSGAITAVNGAAGLIAYISDRHAYLLDLNCNVVGTLPIPAGSDFNSAAFTPDGERLILWDGSSGLVQVWDVASGELLGVVTDVGFVEPFNQLPSEASVSDDGRFLIIRAHNEVSVVDLHAVLALQTDDPAVGRSGGGSSDVLQGTADDDILRGFGGDDQLLGGGGNDLLLGGAGDDSIEGGSGDDTASYAHAGSGVVVNLGLVGPQNTSGDGVDSLIDIENLIGSAHADTLIGNAGDNTLEGGAGDDILRGGDGNDLLVGGLGTDTADYSSAGAAVQVSLGSDQPQNTGGAGQDTLLYIENLIGSDFNDWLGGGAAPSVLEGGAGNDFIQGGLTSTTASYQGATSAVTVSLLIGVAQNTGGAGVDTLSLVDSLIGSAYGDTLTGGYFGNVIEGGGGDDILDGREGVDTASYANASSGVVVDLTRSGPQNTLGAGQDTLVSFENITGSDFNDILTGNAGANVLNGGAGDDRLVGGLGLDTAAYAGSQSGVTVNLGVLTGQNTGGAGTDTLSGIEGVIGSSFNDVLIGDGGANTLAGGDGNDLLIGGAGNDTLAGGAGADTASYAGAASAVTIFLSWSPPQNTGGAGADALSGVENLIGSNFNDTLRGSHYDNLLQGGGGNDVLSGELGDDVLDGGAGVNTASYASANWAVSVNLATGASTGAGGEDTLINIQNLTGSSYNDTLAGNAGANLLDGGAGLDTVSYAAATSAVTVSLAILSAQNTGGAGIDTLASIESLNGSAFGDTLTGDAGANTLNGGDGDDTLIGGLGNDRLIGGLGRDTASYATATAAVSVNLNTLTAQNTGGAGLDTLSGIESLIGSNFNDTLIGDGSDNTLIGGLGADVLTGGAGVDAASYATAASAVTVNLSVLTAQNTGGGGLDTLSGIENLAGSNLNDTLTGDAANNVLFGGGGNDVLAGGDGLNVLDGGAGINTASYASASSGVSANILEGNTMGGGLLDDTLTNIQNLIGSAFHDTLTGDAGVNRLEGGAGNDRLIGGAGNDVLVGGTGVDTAWYGMATGGVTVNLTILSAQNTGGDGIDALSGIEGVVGSDWNDVLIGDAGANQLTGGNGDDVLLGGLGNDVLQGGAGSDTASYATATQAVTASLTTNLQQNTGGAGLEILWDIENLTGGAGNDTLTGNVLNNRLDGGSGADLLNGGGGDDSLTGGLGVDTASYADAASAVTVDLTLTTAQATGGAGSDTLTGIENLTGSGFDDVLTGNALANVLSGLGGDDLLEGGLGADILNGGAGSDTASYAGAASAVTVNLSVATAQNTGGGGLDTLTGVEHVTGSGFNDTLTGDAGANTLNGGAGNDTLIGGLGDDVLDGGAGVNTASYATATASGVTVDLDAGTASGSAGNDTLVNIQNVTGSNFADTLSGDGSDNVLSGGAGNDTLSGGAGNDTLTGGLGVDTAAYDDAASGVTVSLAVAGPQNTQGAGSDTLTGVENLTGSDFNDTLTGDAAANVLQGGAGDDALNGAGGVDTASYADAGAGVTVSLSIAGPQDTQGAGTDTLSAIENLTGSGFDDALTGNAGANGLVGGDGDDVLDGGAGADVLSGGAGSDTASYASAGSAVTVNLSVTTAQSTGGGGLDTLTGVEHVTGSGFNDTLTGDAGANTLNGGAGNDTLIGGLGDDALDGGAGVNTASYATAAGAVTVDLDAGTATGAAGADSLTDIQNVTGSNFADTLSGDASNNVLTGGAGADTLDGGAGDDTLAGGLGVDTATYDDASSGVTVSLAAAGPQNTQGAGSDTLSGVENLTGSAFDDTLTGDAYANVLGGGDGADTLHGGAGNDTLLGGDGDDVLNGGAGADVITGGAGVDTASYAGATSAVTVSLTPTTVQNTLGGGSDTVTGVENLTGSSFNDTLTGDGGDNVITGGLGADRLTGGLGADTFVFNLPADSTAAVFDTIVDFAAGVDRISVQAIDPAGDPGGDFAWAGTAAFSNTAGELRYEISGSAVRVLGDVDGNGVADFAIFLLNTNSLTASDFWL